MSEHQTTPRAQQAAEPTRRRALQLVGLAGLGVVGAGLIVRASLIEPDVAARIVSPGFVPRLCDVVIPAGTTPGAVAAGVPAFLEIAFRHGMFGGDGLVFGKLETLLDRKAGPAGFMKLPPDRQLAILADLDKATFARRAPPPPQTSTANAKNTTPGGISAPAEPIEHRLWRIVKNGIVSTYYTSEIGASQELKYQLAAGPDYRADVAVSDVPYLSNYWIENVF